MCENDYNENEHGGATVMKLIYSKPEIQVICVSQTDILAKSDVLIDGSDLFEEEWQDI